MKLIVTSEILLSAGGFIITCAIIGLVIEKFVLHRRHCDEWKIPFPVRTVHLKREGN